MENHHVAISFKLTLQNNKHNIYQNLKGLVRIHHVMSGHVHYIVTKSSTLIFFRTTYESLRSAIIDLVLATDMSKHFEHLAKFEGAMSSVS